MLEIMLEEQLADSIGGAHNSGFQGCGIQPHIGCSDYLKVNLKKKRKRKECLVN